MTLMDTLVAQPPPLHEDGGRLRIAGTRVSLDSVIYNFKNGAGAVEIIMRFPTLKLEDAYGVLAYYLWRRLAVEEYLAVREQKAGEIEQEIRAASPWKELRQRLPVKRPV